MRISEETGFLLLIISQALHSFEEYYFSLWEVLAPARTISGLFSDDLFRGFAIVNTSIVIFGFWCYFGPVNRSWDTARLFAWFWVLLELANSFGHSYFAIIEGGYFPGLYTMPLLFVFSCIVGRKLVQNRHVPNVT